MKDFLVFISDQHNGRVMGCAGDPVVNTPNMDALAADGTCFETAYTSCPLCVPARMSMLSAKLPSKTGLFTNTGTLPEETPTFLHLLANAGYETVLCGRMHFDGLDQRHGFTKRIAQDITPTTMGCGQGPVRGQVGMLAGEPYALQIVGGGNNLVHHYDRMVVEEAIRYLSWPHDKPQCIFVGTYAPHSPYIAPKELYESYLDKVTLPPDGDRAVAKVHPAEAKRKAETDPEVLCALRAAYYGCVEFADGLVGETRKAWDEYLARENRQGVFVYLSDHGDMNGSRGFWAKQSLYESAERIPFLMAGEGVPAGKRVPGPVSIMDLGPTLCAMAGVECALPEQDGVSLLDAVEGDAGRGAPVLAEWITDPFFNGNDFGRMVAKDGLKLISYNTYPEADELYRPGEDPWEMNDRAAQLPEQAAELRAIAWDGINAEEVVRKKNLRETGAAIVKKFRRTHRAENTETWEPTPEQAAKPEEYVSTRSPLIPPMQKAWDRGSWME